MGGFEPQVVTVRHRRRVVIRLLTPDDGASLGDFFEAVPERDRYYFFPHELDRANAQRLVTAPPERGTIRLVAFEDRRREDHRREDAPLEPERRTPNAELRTPKSRSDDGLRVSNNFGVGRSMFGVRSSISSTASHRPGTEDEGSPLRFIGYAYVAERSPAVSSLGICILPEFQSLGLGGAMMEALLAQARDAGIAKVILTVHLDNPRALRLYRRLGFRQVETFVNESQGALQARMELVLRAAAET